MDGLLFLNAAPIFHREGHRPRIVRQTKSPILRVFDTADGRAVMVNLSGTERWRELCRLLDMDDGGLDYSSPEGLVEAVRQGVEPEDTAASHRGVRNPHRGRVGGGTARAAGRRRQVQHPGRVAGPRAGPHGGRGGTAGTYRVAPGGQKRSGRRHGSEHGALGGHRIVDLSSFWAGPAGGTPAGRARGRRREGGAARRRGRVPAHAGAAQHLRGREPVQAGARPRPQDRGGPGPAARPGGGVRRRGRERDGGGVGAPRPGRGAAAGGQPFTRLRPGQGLRGGGAAGGATLLRLRRPGGDRNGDEPGWRSEAGARQLHDQRLRDGAAAGGGGRAVRCWDGRAARR